MPPAPAQKSSTVAPPTSSATSWLPSSCTSKEPSRYACSARTFGRSVVTIRAWRLKRPGRVCTPSASSACISASRVVRRALTRRQIGPGLHIASASAPASSASSRRRIASIQSGYDHLSARRSGAGLGGGHGGGSAASSAARCSGTRARSRSNAKRSARGSVVPA